MTESKKILVVDDHPTSRLKLNMAVKKLGHDVEMAAGGGEALGKLRANPDFNLVLLDILMPDVDGHQVLRTMQQEGSLAAIPVVVVSSITDDLEVTICMDEGAVGSLNKDFAPEDLPVCIEQFAN